MNTVAHTHITSYRWVTVYHMYAYIFYFTVISWLQGKTFFLSFDTKGSNHCSRHEEGCMPGELPKPQLQFGFRHTVSVWCLFFGQTSKKNQLFTHFLPNLFKGGHGSW